MCQEVTFRPAVTVCRRRQLHSQIHYKKKNMQDEMYKTTQEKITALHKNTEALRSAIHCCNGRSSAHRCLTEGTVKSGLNLRVSQENIRICACQMWVIQNNITLNTAVNIQPKGLNIWRAPTLDLTEMLWHDPNSVVQSRQPPKFIWAVLLREMVQNTRGMHKTEMTCIFKWLIVNVMISAVTALTHWVPVYSNWSTMYCMCIYCSYYTDIG